MGRENKGERKRKRKIRLEILREVAYIKYS